jgi:hypothetical protein
MLAGNMAAAIRRRPTWSGPRLRFNPGELGVVRRTARGLSTLRLILGILRLWIINIFGF